MIRSFLARAFGPHLALFAVLIARDWIAPLGTPEAPSQLNAFVFLAVRILPVILGIPLAWAASLTLIGSRGWSLPSWPSWLRLPEEKQETLTAWQEVGRACFAGLVSAILIVPFIGMLVTPGWIIGAINIGALTLASLWMYLTFRERLGPELRAALEARRREQDERRKREGRRRTLVLQVERDRQEIERLKSSPLGDDAEDEILEVQILLRKHEDELALFDAGGES